MILRLAQKFHQLRNDDRGVSAIEFAFIAPLMVAMYLGTVELGLGWSIDRKNAQVARSLSDLAAQGTNIDAAEMDNIFNAATAVMTPFDSTRLATRIECIQIDNDGNATVTWGRGRGLMPRPNGTPVVLPVGIAAPNTSIVIARSEFAYDPAVGFIVTGTLNLENETLMATRTGRTCPRLV